MNDVRETCPCGAEWVGTKFYASERNDFRKAHAACRQRAAEPAPVPIDAMRRFYVEKREDVIAVVDRTGYLDDKLFIIGPLPFTSKLLTRDQAIEKATKLAQHRNECELRGKHAFESWGKCSQCDASVAPEVIEMVVEDE